MHRHQELMLNYSLLFAELSCASRSFGWHCPRLRALNPQIKSISSRPSESCDINQSQSLVSFESPINFTSSREPCPVTIYTGEELMPPTLYFLFTSFSARPDAGSDRERLVVTESLDVIVQELENDLNLRMKTI